LCGSLRNQERGLTKLQAARDKKFLKSDLEIPGRCRFLRHPVQLTNKLF
jgi:hypothetical protein